MTDWLPGEAAAIFGEGAVAEEAYALLTVDVPPAGWTAAVTAARDELGCTFFDWLSAVDEPGTGFRICVHLVALPSGERPVRRLLLRTTVPHDAPVLPSLTGVFAGAGWHERETHEMFGVDFEGHPGLTPLLLPDSFEGHPLRKDFVLAARVAKAWPGAKEPGESEHGGPKRRQMLPPGVPDPNEWGPLKGQLPDAPPARRARASGDRPARRTRTAGPSGAAGDTGATGAGAAAEPGQARPPRRSRSVSEGSASQRAAGERSAGETGEVPPAEEAAPPARPARRNRSASGGSASQRAEPGRRSADAPWHDPRSASGDAAPPASGERTSTESAPSEGEAPPAPDSPDSPGGRPAEGAAESAEGSGKSPEQSGKSSEESGKSAEGDG